MRRGEYSKFDAESMLPGEWAVVLSGDTSAIDGKAVYICTSAGVTKRMATIDDLAMVAANANPEVFDQIRTALVNALSDIRDAESKRVTVENTRVENEKKRIDAEDSRASAETLRQSNETARQSSEQTRQTNENTRKSNETARQSNESTRQANEATRQSTYIKSATATTLDPSASATASIVSNVLQLGIPRGKKGDNGGLNAHICSSSEYSTSGDRNVPTITGDTSTIYLTPKVSSEANDAYDQWMYVNSAWDVIGGGSDSTMKSTVSTLSNNVDAITLELSNRLPVYYYSTTPTESTVKSDHTTPCLVVVSGGATYLVE